MSVKGIHSREGFVASSANMVVHGSRNMESVMALAVVLPRKTLVASRPFADIGPFFGMGPQVTSQVESTGECTPAPWYRTLI